MYSNHFDKSVDCIALCHDLLTNICCEADKFIVTIATREIKLADSGIHLNNVATRNKDKVTPTEQFDLDNYMKHYYSRQDHLETEDNGDIPQLLLLSIQRCHQYTDRNNINNQEIKFSDTITVLSTNKTELQYTLTGYVLFTGDHTKGHYKVICRGEHNRWFLYNDEKTKQLNVRERDSYWYKRQVMFLLYADNCYYNNETVDCDGAL
jgi:hypothetical protein